MVKVVSDKISHRLVFIPFSKLQERGQTEMVKHYKPLGPAWEQIPWQEAWQGEQSSFSSSRYDS